MLDSRTGTRPDASGIIMWRIARAAMARPVIGDRLVAPRAAIIIWGEHVQS
jgi:hypothetical protein